MKSTFALGLTLSMFLTACDSGPSGYTYDYRQSKVVVPAAPTPSPVVWESSGSPTPAPSPSSARRGTCWEFEVEENSSALRGFWSKLSGVWIHDMPGFTRDQTSDGETLYEKVGYEINPSAGVLGTIYFKYSSIVGENADRNYVRRTEADSKLSTTLVSKVLTEGKWIGFRIVESFDESSRKCATVFLRVHEGKLELGGYSFASQGARFNPKDLEGLGFNKFSRIR